ncbi:hypothetical protein IKO70_08300 [bacterium]|nr:hypothetical protein [bacterium]
MKFIFALLFLSLISPSEMMTKMTDTLYIPDKKISVQGVDGENNTVRLEFDKDKKILVKTEKGEKSEIKFADMPLFLKLFFFTADKTAPESLVVSAKSISGALHAAGINTEVSTVSASEYDGSAVLAIGKEKRFVMANVLELSKESMRPVTLKIGDETFVFSDYHRSQLPLAFPGNIKFFKNGALQGEWIFLRDEYKQK